MCCSNTAKRAEENEMKVLFLVYRDFMNPDAVGGDLYFWELAKGLSKIGHAVSILCSKFPGSKDEENIEGIRIIRVNGQWTLSFKIFKQYFQKFKGNVDVVIEEAIGGQRFPFFSTLYVIKPLVAVWHQRNSKIFREQYALPLAEGLSFLELLQARLYRNRTIVTPSRGAREQVLLLGFKRENVKVVYDGVPLDFLENGSSSKRQNVIVCLGKIRRYKRPDHAILALANIVKVSNTQCRLVIAGKVSEIDRVYLVELNNFAKKLGVSDQVDFKLNISEEEKIGLLKTAKVLVQPSPVEGFSIVVIEANACGTPVVVSDGVPGDVVVNGYNGFMYPFGNIEKFSALTNQLLSDNTVWEKMSSNAHYWAHNFTWKKSSDELNKVLMEVLKES
jgi:glycosyltransferase involved in cell wall biosynthesis